MQERVHIVENVFTALGGTSATARELGVKQSAASEMRRRKSIPVRYWPRLVDKEIPGVTYEALAKAHGDKAQDASEAA